jgi:hypothetical protein
VIGGRALARSTRIEKEALGGCGEDVEGSVDVGDRVVEVWRQSQRHTCESSTSPIALRRVCATE